MTSPHTRTRSGYVMRLWRASRLAPPQPCSCPEGSVSGEAGTSLADLDVPSATLANPPATCSTLRGLHPSGLRRHRVRLTAGNDVGAPCRA